MLNKRGVLQKNKTLFFGSITLLFLVGAFFVLAANTFVSPSTDGANITGSVTLNCTFDTNLDNITNVSFYNGTTLIGTDFNESLTDIAYNITWNTASAADGLYTLYCNATNSTNDKLSLTRSNIRVDNNVPLVSINTPLPGWYNSNFTVNATVTDGSGSGAQTVQYNSSGSATWVTMTDNGAGDWSATFDITSLADGNYTFRINATDYVGLENTSELVLNMGIDDTNPQIDYYGLTENDVVYRNRDWVYVNVSLTETNLKNITFYLFNSSSEVINTTTFTDSTRNINFTSLNNDMVYYYNVTSNDMAGNTNSTATRTITLDSTNPVLFNPIPINSNYIQGTSSQLFEINLTEQNNDSVKVYYAATSPVPSTFSSTLVCSGTAPNLLCNNTADISGFGEGTLYYFFNTSDLAGSKGNNGTSSSPLSVTIDRTNPSISNLASDDADNVTRSDTKINFTVTASDTASLSTVTLNGTTMSAGSGNTYFLYTNTSDLGCGSDGACALTATATDAAGNTNSTSYTLTVDNSTPQLSYLGTESSGTGFSRNWIYVNVSLTETNLNNIVYRLYNSSLEVINTSTFTTAVTNINFTSLNQNMLYYYNVTATDKAGNTNSTATRNLTLDSTNPSISNLASDDADNVTRSDTKINFTVTASDTNLVNVSLNGTLMGAGSGNTYFLYSNTSELGCTSGTCEFVATALDLAGNTNTASYNVTIDNTNPLIDYSSVGMEVNNSYFARDYISVNVSVTETNENQITFYLFNSSLDTVTSQVLVAGARNITFSGLNQNMVYYFNVTDSDLAGNTNSTATRVQTLDNTNPVVSFGAGTESSGTYFNRDWVYVNVSVTETNEDNITFRLYNTSEIVNTTTLTAGTRTINFTGLDSNMVYTYNVTVEDKAGNSGSSTTNTIILDSTNPSVSSLNNYADNEWIATKSATFGFTTTEANPDICVLYHNASGWATNVSRSYTNAVAANFSQITFGSDGKYIWNTWCNDSAGNSAYSSSNYTLNVDSANPAVVLNSPADNYWSTSASVTFNWTPTDTNLEDCVLYGNFTGGTWGANTTITTGVSGTSNITALTLADGIYNWNVWCNDSATNSAYSSSNRTIKVDTNVPTIVSALDGTTASSRTITFNVTQSSGPSVVNSSTIAVSGLTTNFDVTTDCASITNGYRCSYIETGLTAGATNNILIDADNTAGGSATQYDLSLTMSMAQNYTLALASGWNLISTPLVMTNSNIDYTVANDSLITKMYYYNGTGWQIWDSSGSDSLTTMEPRKGYWVNTTSATNLYLFGEYTTGTPPQAYTGLSLTTGWHTISAYDVGGSDNVDTDDALASLCGTNNGGLCSAGDRNWDALYYYDTSTSLLVNMLNLDLTGDNMWDKGRGFWIYINTADTYV